MNRVQVVWYKRDLRVEDHKPLCVGSERGEILPVYVVEPELWKLPDSSCKQWSFIHDALMELRRRIEGMGGILVIKVGEVVEVLRGLRGRLGEFSLLSYEETGNDWTYKRDERVRGWCRENGIKWYEYPSNGVVRRLRSRDEWARIRNERMAEAVLEVPDHLKFVKSIESDELPGKMDSMFGEDIMGTPQLGGRKEGLRLLGSFLGYKGKRYLQSISKPELSEAYSSRLSAHIAFGTLSIKEIEKAVKNKMKEIAAEEKDSIGWKRNLNAFLSRLAWRCHFIQKLEQQPDIEFYCMHRGFEGMREEGFRQDFLDAWIEGNTGYPLVDACMRALRKNGWITFRMRAMLVSFASYHLWLDWRKTAPVLARLFTDYEPGIHYSQFQMQSGVTGINAIRIYNPIKQSYDQDKNGTFIRKYVKELSKVDVGWIHEPWLMNMGREMKLGYRGVIVDHEVAVRRAREELSKVMKSKYFREEAKTIYEKLGSRKRTTKSSEKSKSDKGGTQLLFDF